MLAALSPKSLHEGTYLKSHSGSECHSKGMLLNCIGLLGSTMPRPRWGIAKTQCVWFAVSELQHLRFFLSSRYGPESAAQTCKVATQISTARCLSEVFTSHRFGPAARAFSAIFAICTTAGAMGGGGGSGRRDAIVLRGVHVAVEYMLELMWTLSQIVPGRYWELLGSTSGSPDTSSSSP